MLTYVHAVVKPAQTRGETSSEKTRTAQLRLIQDPESQTIWMNGHGHMPVLNHREAIMTPHSLRISTDLLLSCSIC